MSINIARNEKEGNPKLSAIYFLFNTTIFSSYSLIMFNFSSIKKTFLFTPALLDDIDVLVILHIGIRILQNEN